MPFLTYDEGKLIGAGANVYFAPFATTKPVQFNDVFDGTSPYAPKTGWSLFGATSAAPTIGRTITTAGFSIQQSNTTLLEEPTDISRTLTVPIAEFSPANLALLEESTSATFAAAVKRGPGNKIPFGTIESFSSFRIAIATMKSKKQGVNTEGAGGLKRGAFVSWIGYNASLVGDSLSTSIGKGELSAISVQFKLYPDPTETVVGKEYGFWSIEDGNVTVATV